MLKRIISILWILAIPFTVIQSQDKPVKIGYTNLDYILGQLPEFQLLRRNMNRLLSAAAYGEDFPSANVWVGQDDAIV